MKININSDLNCNYKLKFSKTKAVVIKSLQKKIFLDVSEEEYKYCLQYKPRLIRIEKYTPETDLKVDTPIPDKWNLTKIPKIAHFYWGNRSLPYLRALSIISFHVLNPDWKVNLYVPKEKYSGKVTWNTGELNYKVDAKDYFSYLKSFKEINIVQFDFNTIGIKENIPESFKSDFLRWHLLSTVGGLWNDNDIQFFKPMNCFYKNLPEYADKEFWLCFHGFHSCGFLMSSKENKFFKKILEFAKKNFNLKEYQSAGPDLFKAFGLDDLKKLNEYNFENMDMDIVYPIDSTKIPLIYNSNNINLITKNSIGLHWYAGHKLAEKYVNELTEKNYMQYNNTLSYCIRKYFKALGKQNNFKIITAVRNSELYIKNCIESVINQRYKNWNMIIIDDNSTDSTQDIIKSFKDKRIKKIFNEERKTKFENIITAIGSCKDDDIIVMLDGDDWLSGNDVLDYLNKIYNDSSVWITYGQYEPASKSYSNYCSKIDSKTYRKNGIWRTSHLKTFKKFLWNNIDKKDFIASTGKYYYIDDAAFMFPMIEMAGNNHSRFIEKVLYIYNDLNPECGMKLVPEQTLVELKEIVGKPQYKELKEKVSILITTFKRTNLLDWNLRSLDRQNLNEKYDLEILILDEDNDTENINKLISKFKNLNIKYIQTSKTKNNINDWRIPGYALNIGVKKVSGDYIIMLCAEIFSLNNSIEKIIEPLIIKDKLMTIPDLGWDDSNGEFLKQLKENNGTWEENIFKSCGELNTIYPYMMGIRKNEYMEIGGYDESFKGITSDDDNFLVRLKNNGCNYLRVNCGIVHLYHPRIYDTRFTNDEVNNRIEYNRKLYYERINDIEANVGIEWGKYEI